MPQRSLYMLIGAVCLGLLAVFVMRFYIGTGGAATVATAAEAPRPTHVVVVNEAVPSGGKIDPAKLKLVDWPAGAVPPGAFGAIADVGVDKQAAVALIPGEPLLAARLAGPGGIANIAAALKPGMRAATIRVTDVTGTGGFVLPGGHVDIVLTRAAAGQNTPFTDVLAQNILVLAVNQDNNQAKDKPEVVQSVTIEVTPLLGQKLALAQTVGTVSLVLRNPAQAEAARVQTVHVDDLRDGYVVASTAAPRVVRRRVRVVRATRRAPTSNTIEVVRGVDRSLYTVARIG